MKTRDKILRKSLDLFNEQGERNVTTNHIAAAMGISPGNLYYHFRNKEEIIYELFLQYRGRTTVLLLTPPDRAITMDDKARYFEGLFENMWDYRFLHRDLEQLLSGNEALRISYRDFAREVMEQAREICRREVEAGFIAANTDDIDALIVNIWVVATSWASFLHTTGIYGVDADLSRNLLKRGIYQIICLFAPYTRGEALEKLPEIKRIYASPCESTQALSA